MINRLSLASLLCGIALAAALPAAADAAIVTIGLQDADVNGGVLTTIGVPGAGLTGVVGLAYGTFTVNNISATSDPIVTDSINGQSINATTGAGVLKVFITAQGLTAPTGAFFSSFTENSLTAGVSVQEL